MKDLEQAQVLLTAAQRDLSALAGMDNVAAYLYLSPFLPANGLLC